MAQVRSTFNLDEVIADIEGHTQINAQRAAFKAEAAIKRQLTGQRSGAQYKVSETGKLHTASAEGESPAVLSGDLRASVTTAPAPGNAKLYYVGSDKLYAVHLEQGTKFMEPRPYFVKAVKQALADIRRELGRSMN